MRQIEFRAQRADTREWVYGDLTHSVSVKDGVEKRHTLIGTDFDFIEVIPETVGQFTGLLDENGSKVFEGDIISSNQWNPREYKVIFENGEFSFVSLLGLERPYTNSIHYVENFSIIGTIHDEPDPTKTK